MGRKQSLFNLATELGIEIKNVVSPLQSSLIGIHLLNPTLDDLEDALATAERDQFPVIWVHSNATFAKGARK